MNSNILIKINSIIKNRLIELLGVALIIGSLFLLSSIVSYYPDDPNFIYKPENTEIKNIGGFYGSVVSDFLLQSFGLISFLLIINFFYWGLKLLSEKKIRNIVEKFFFVIVYLIFGTTVLYISYNSSFWLGLDSHGNGGFVGRLITQNIYYFTPLIENQYVIYSLALLTLVFFVLSLGIKLREIIYIFTFPFVITKKII